MLQDNKIGGVMFEDIVEEMKGAFLEINDFQSDFLRY